MAINRMTTTAVLASENEDDFISRLGMLPTQPKGEPYHKIIDRINAMERKNYEHAMRILQGLPK